MLAGLRRSLVSLCSRVRPGAEDRAVTGRRTRPGEDDHHGGGGANPSRPPERAACRPTRGRHPRQSRRCRRARCELGCHGPLDGRVGGSIATLIGLAGAAPGRAAGASARIFRRAEPARRQGTGGHHALGLPIDDEVHSCERLAERSGLDDRDALHDVRDTFVRVTCHDGAHVRRRTVGRGTDVTGP